LDYLCNSTLTYFQIVEKYVLVVQQDTPFIRRNVHIVSIWNFLAD